MPEKASIRGQCPECAPGPTFRVCEEMAIEPAECCKLTVFPRAFSPRTLIRGEGRDPWFRHSHSSSNCDALLNDRRLGVG
jgi:hypothetical protein